MEFNKLKIVYVNYEDDKLISIQEDFGQNDDSKLSVAGCWNPTDKGAACAQLFTSAPELLSALEMILADDDCLLQIDALYAAQKAIAKAYGKEQ